MTRKHLVTAGILPCVLFAIGLDAARQNDHETDPMIRKDEHVYGNSFRAVAMSIEPDKEQYRLGGPIGIKVLIKNSGETEIVLQGIRRSRSLYRLGLFFPDGRAVPTTDYMKKIEENWDKPPSVFSVLRKEVKPGQTTAHWFDIYPIFDIKEPGTYHLVAMRRIESWDKGFMISNMVKINVVDK